MDKMKSEAKQSTSDAELHRDTMRAHIEFKGFANQVQKKNSKKKKLYFSSGIYNTSEVPQVSEVKKDNRAVVRCGCSTSELVSP